MTKRGFQVSHWLGTPKGLKDNIHDKGLFSEPKKNDPFLYHSNPVVDSLKPFINKFNDHDDSEKGLKKFFVPGWNGEALLSKETKEFKKVLDIVHTDCKKHFLQLSSLNKRAKASIYDEFLSYLEFKAISCPNLDSYQSFWEAISSRSSEYKNHLHNFIDVYCHRVSVIYLLKIRFISLLMNERDELFSLKNFLYSSSYLTNLFKQGSQSELKSSILRPNLYSWYRPGPELEKTLKTFFYISPNLLITDVIKTTSQKLERIIAQNTDYSHALSHKSFGLFLNSVLLNFPLWKKSVNGKSVFGRSPSEYNTPQTISCKFAGDFLESLSLSHWLAQDSNKGEKWNEILCPHFKKDDFANGEYLKIFNETQFLTFLTQIAKHQNIAPVHFISSISQELEKNLTGPSGTQKSFLIEENLNEQTYDRVVVNLNKFPKNNSQHMMINKILEESKSLKDDGILVSLSSKKLFIASQKSKIENLLSHLKVEAILSLQDVTGKGEIGAYITIFSLRKYHIPKLNKENVLHFRFSGELQSFSKFSQVTHMMQTFFINNLKSIPAFYHKSLKSLKIEIFQDAIVDGRLMHSSSKDSSQITHPMFFKNLMNSCLPLEVFFEIQQVNFDKSKSFEGPIFEYSNDFYNENQNEMILIVDKRSKEKTFIEIIPESLLELKSYEYGTARCTYFKIFPKYRSINIEAVQSFYNSSIGAQIVDLTFGAGHKKIKSALTQLLLPRFYSEFQQIPEHIFKGISFLELEQSDLLDLHPTQFKDQFLRIERLCESISQKYPQAIVGILSKFSRNIEQCLEKLGSNCDKRINFNNPVIKSPLILSKTYPIYPDNPDIFIEFSSEDSLSLIHNLFDQVKVKKVIKDDLEVDMLELKCQGRAVLNFYSGPEMLSFLEFIFESLDSVPISSILQGVSVPRLDDLCAIIESYKTIQRSFLEVSQALPKIIDKIINTNISTH